LIFSCKELFGFNTTFFNEATIGSGLTIGFIGSLFVLYFVELAGLLMAKIFVNDITVSVLGFNDANCFNVSARLKLILNIFLDIHLNLMY